MIKRHIKLFEAFIKPYPEHPDELDPYSFNDTLKNFYYERIRPTIQQDNVPKLKSYLGKTHIHGSVGFDSENIPEVGGDYTNKLYYLDVVNTCVEYDAFKCLKYLISIGYELKFRHFETAACFGNLDMLKYLFSVIDENSMFTKVDISKLIKSCEKRWSNKYQTPKFDTQEIINYLKSKL